jgi:hypothetical protein
MRAIQTEHRRDYGQAAAIYADAAERWEAFTNVLEHAYALLGQGRCLAHVGDAAADRPLREARHLFEGMGARPRVSDCDRLIAETSKLRA